MLYGIILSVMVIYVIYYVKRFSKNLVRQLSVNNIEIREEIVIDGDIFPIKQTFKLEGLSCEHCAAFMENKLNQSNYKGIIDFKNKDLTIYSKEYISFDEIKNIVENAGFVLVQ